MSTLKANGVQTLGGKPILNSTGSILQVVQGLNATQFSTTNLTTYDYTGLSATITPGSNTSKIYVLIAGTVQNSSANGGTYVALFKNSSFLFNDNLQQYSAGGNNLSAMSLNYLDSPATTSPTTYQLYITVYNTGISYRYNTTMQLLVLLA